jgi:2-polyprenyl-3-methyl-5-hydroxy-6-metoxy-1,4-benzoquinol methylase
MTSSHGYLVKPPEYFDAVRTDVLGLLPHRLGRVLDIGCGTGQSLRWVRAHRECSWTEGIEIHSLSARTAAAVADRVLFGDAEDIVGTLAPDSFDTVLCLDSLEHMRNPWVLMSGLRRIMTRDAHLLISVPNVRHLRVVIPLVLKGSFQYAESGLLDRTHLRFFTRASLLEAVTQAGFEVLETSSTGLAPWSKAWVANTLTLGLLRPFLEFQLVALARMRRDAKAEQP